MTVSDKMKESGEELESIELFDEFIAVCCRLISFPFSSLGSKWRIA